MNHAKYLLCYVYLSITRLFLSICQINCCHYGTEVYFNKNLWFCGDVREIDEKIIVDIWRFNRKTGNIDRMKVDQNELVIRKTLSNLIYNGLCWWRDYKENYLKEDALYRSNKNILYSYLVLGRHNALGLNYKRI